VVFALLNVVFCKEFLMDMKNIILLYGGRSGEHEVSRISAASVYTHINEDRYDVTLVGITQEGFWYLQDKPEKRTGSLSMVENPERLVSVVPGGGLVCGGKRLSVDLVFPVRTEPLGKTGRFKGFWNAPGFPMPGPGCWEARSAWTRRSRRGFGFTTGCPLSPLSSPVLRTLLMRRA
jgi:hypothetical protein